MKTPENIKMGLKRCYNTGSCLEDCPYRKLDFPECVIVKCDDALAYIQQLEADKAELLTKVEQLQAERDAALDDKRGECTHCAFLPGETIPDTCFDCANKGYYRWEWRGVQKEE